jgi:hypothetical protein
MANKAYQFPQGEPNPFAETTPQNAPDGGANPFAVGNEPVRSVDPGPGAYQQTLQQRSGTILAFAVVGLVGAVIALPLGYWYVPAGVFSLATSVPALLMARHDLEAMRLGAMDARQRKSVQTANIFAIIGVVIGVISLLICAASLASEFLSNE